VLGWAASHWMAMASSDQIDTLFGGFALGLSGYFAIAVICIGIGLLTASFRGRSCTGMYGSWVGGGSIRQSGISAKKSWKMPMENCSWPRFSMANQLFKRQSPT
jgi:hypothetical protein